MAQLGSTQVFGDLAVKRAVHVLAGDVQMNDNSLDFSLGGNDIGGVIHMTNVSDNDWAFKFDTNSHGGTNSNSSGFWVSGDGDPDMRLRQSGSTVTAKIDSDPSATSFVDSAFEVGSGLVVEGSTRHSYAGITAGSSANNGHLMVDSNGGNLYLNWEDGGEIRIGAGGGTTKIQSGLNITGGGLDINGSKADWGDLGISQSDISPGNLGSDPNFAGNSLGFKGDTVMIYADGNSSGGYGWSGKDGIKFQGDNSVSKAALYAGHIQTKGSSEFQGRTYHRGGIKMYSSLNVNGNNIDNVSSLDITGGGELRFVANGGALQRGDARSDGNEAWLHWYGKDDGGGAQEARHRFYDGSSYVDFRAVSNEIRIGGDVKANDFVATSDLRRKEGVQTITSALGRVEAFRGITFDWAESGEHSAGVGAQEVEWAFPVAVSESEDGTKNVNTMPLLGLHTEAIGELSRKLRSETERLERRIQMLERKLNQLQ